MAIMIRSEWYYYLHSNRSLIGRNPYVVEQDQDYFDSPFVEHWWQVDRMGGKTALLSFLCEAIELGAKVDDVIQLMKQFGITEDDGWKMMNAEDFSYERAKGIYMIFDLVWRRDRETVVDILGHMIAQEKQDAHKRKDTGEETGEGEKEKD